MVLAHVLAHKITVEVTHKVAQVGPQVVAATQMVVEKMVLAYVCTLSTNGICSSDSCINSIS